ncbi:MAG: glycosyl hydrolase, partial [Pseudomonadota bacterium]
GSIGAVAVSEWDPNVIYVGTGEKTVRGNVSPGDGMWKSVDAGDSWRRVGLEDSQHISRIRIHPKNPDLAYAAVMGHLFGPNEQRGVFRTRDGGVTWEKVLFVDREVGAVDLVMDPTNPRILYASFWRIKRTPYSLESGGPGSGLYKSVDGGDTWVELSQNEGLPKGTLGIIGLAVSPSNNKNVYALIEAEDGGLFRSQDGGKRWQKTSDDRNLRQRAWYYTRVYADPLDDESVYVTNVDFHFSKDGGKTFAVIGTPHTDNHDLWIDPADPKRMIQANDGGANISYNGGLTWSTQSNQPTVQFYRVSTDNDFPYRLLGGQQDNSAVRIRSQSFRGDAITTRDWEPTAGGESGHIVAKPDNPNIVVGGSYGGLLRLVDHDTGESRSIDVWPDNPMGYGAKDLRYRFQWNYPILFSQHDPDSLYVAANVLFKSTNLGQSWTQLSPDLTRNDKSKMGKSGGPITKDDTSVEYYGTIFAIAESSHEAGVLWAGSDDGRIHLTRNAGETWDDVTPAALPEWSMVNSIDVDPFNPGGVYLAATRYKLDDFSPYLFYTSNWGRSWKRIHGDIPKAHFTRVLRADPQTAGLLYAGTERGVYFSRDNGRSWSSLQLDLPIVPITDMQVKGDDLVVATQGRGYWILDDLPVLRQQAEGVNGDEPQLYIPGKSYRLLAGGRDKDVSKAGTNPYEGVSFFYQLPADLQDEQSLSLSVYAPGEEAPLWTWTGKTEDESEEPAVEGEVDTAVLGTKAGLHRHVWNLEHPGMERFDNLILWADMKAGPKAVPGVYRAVLQQDTFQKEVRFEVLADPRSQATPENYAEQFAFVVQSRDLLTRTHREIKRIRALRSQLDSLLERLKSEPEDPITAKLNELNALLTEVEEALYQTKNESRQDPLNFPIRLNNKLVSLMRTVAQDDLGPTEQAWKVKAELSAAIERQLAKLDSVWSEQVPALNDAVRAQGVDMISLEKLASED